MANGGVLDLLINAGAPAGVDIEGEFVTWSGGKGDLWVSGNLGGGSVELHATIGLVTDTSKIVCIVALPVTSVFKFDLNHGTKLRAVISDTTMPSSGVFARINT